MALLYKHSPGGTWAPAFFTAMGNASHWPPFLFLGEIIPWRQPSSEFLTFPFLLFHQKSWSGLAKMVCKWYWDKMSQLSLLRKNPSLLPREGIKILTTLQQTGLLNVTVPKVYWWYLPRLLKKETVVLWFDISRSGLRISSYIPSVVTLLEMVFAEWGLFCIYWFLKYCGFQKNPSHVSIASPVGQHLLYCFTS